MAYGSTPYVGMAPKKNGGHIKSAQMTRSNAEDEAINDVFVLFFIAVQIFFEERQHWITTAMINGEVYLFDCLFNGTLTPSAELQIAQLYKPLISSNGLLVSVVPKTRQVYD